MERCSSCLDFVKTKANNFRAFLKQHSTNPESDALIATYTEDQLVPLVMTYLMPLYATGQLDVAVKSVVEQFKNETPEFADKVRRYFECFCESLT